jgi:arylformamidase
MIDISVSLFHEMDVYEGDPSFHLEPIQSIENGDKHKLSKVSMCVHSGTHIDAPCYYIQNGKSIDQISPEFFVGKCMLIEIHNEDSLITIKHISSILETDKILFKTTNQPGKFSQNYTSLSLETSYPLIEKGIKLIGIDSFSIESFFGNGDVHCALLEKEIVILETLDLTRVSPGIYELICLPIKLCESDGSPARAVLILIK